MCLGGENRDQSVALNTAVAQHDTQNGQEPGTNRILSAKRGSILFHCIVSGNCHPRFQVQMLRWDLDHQPTTPVTLASTPCVYPYEPHPSADHVLGTRIIVAFRGFWGDLVGVSETGNPPAGII